MQWILCSMAQSIPIEYSGFHAASMNARIPCIVAQWILIVCNGVHAARPKASRLNAVDFMRHGPKHPDWKFSRFQHSSHLNQMRVWLSTFPLLIFFLSLEN